MIKFDLISKNKASEPLPVLFKCYLFFYSMLMRAVAPLLYFKAIRRGRTEPGYLYAINERFANYEASAGYLKQFKEGAIWIHAVSLGETRAAQVLVKAILEGAEEKLETDITLGNNDKACKDVRFLLTHSTATGRQAGLELIQNLGLNETNSLQVWYPWDTPGGVYRFLAQFKPKLGLLMETEVWPNMVIECYKAKLPLILVNARMNEKSFKSAIALGDFAKNVYKRLTAVVAQTPEDAERLYQLNAPVIGSLGNLKFDASVNLDQLSSGKTFSDQYYQKYRKPIILFASSREGEEAQLFHALLANRSLTQSVQWLIVPRHPQRFDEVRNIGLQFGFAVSKRVHQSVISPGINYFEQNVLNPNLVSDIWIGDSVGEMPLYYGMASASLLGGSFEALGGQNLIEAAACGCPVVMGPHVFNFAQAAQHSIARGAAIQVRTLHEAAILATQIALDRARQEQMSALAIEFALDNRGAVSKTLDALRTYL